MVTESKLTVVMYHYVRDLENSRYPRINGLAIDRFRGQLDYLAKHHTFVRVEDVMAACRGDQALPSDAVLLTFDDGYADNYRYAFPLLDERGVQGCFFPPVASLRDRVVLDVNKIHFALAAIGDVEAIATFCLEKVAAWRDEYGLEEPGYYESHLARTSRFDDPRTLFVKDLLQRGLPETVRSRLTDEVFRRFVSVDEKAFAEELYLTMDQAQTMRRHGHYFGAHGLSHRWLDSLPAEEQRAELQVSLELMRQLGYRDGEFVVSYPYGGFDEHTLPVARELGFGLGFSVEARTATIGQDDPLLLPRLDTVDLPFSG